MAGRTEFIIYARRVHNALRHAIEDGDGRTDDQWLHKERPLFEHYSCAIYLAGCLSFLEDKYGTRPWRIPAKTHLTLDSFIQDLPDHPRDRFTEIGVSDAGLEALICIRNALTHNDSDLSRNEDKTCIDTVPAAAIPGVAITGNVVRLMSNRTVDFMEYERRSLVAVSMYHGDG